MRSTKASTTWNRYSHMHIPMYADTVTHTYPGEGGGIGRNIRTFEWVYEI